MIAELESLVGNWIVKVPEETVLSPPKSIEHTALLAVRPVIEAVL